MNGMSIVTVSEETWDTESSRSVKRRLSAGLMMAVALTCSVCIGESRRIVHDGETLSWPHAYTYYRFVVKDRDSAGQYLRIAEIALYDIEGNRINAGLSLAADDYATTTNLPTGTFSIYDSNGTLLQNKAGKGGKFWNTGNMFDGNLSTAMNGWAHATSEEWTWYYITMRLAADAGPVASYNVAFAVEGNAPRSWALQGSDNNTTWITLDDMNDAAVAAIAPDGAGWCNGGEAIPVADESGHVFVQRGGTLSVVTSARAKSIHSSGGNVSIASGATLGVTVGANESACLTGSGLSGGGTFEKMGGGTIAVSGVNSAFAGKIRVTGGILAFRPLHAAPRFTYYRFIVKDRAATYLSIAELALYDADGKRINLNLAQAAEPEWSSTNLLPGTYAKFGNNTTDKMSETAKNMFDGDLSTDVQGWMDNVSGNEWYWIYFNMRLPEGSDVEPASYNLAFTSQTDRAPKSWALQGSDDLATWFTLDERDATAVAAIAPDGAGWCNGGTPLPLAFEGDNAPIGETDAKYFRFTVKGVGGTDGTRALSELSLYDMQGRRLNVGLASMGINCSAVALPAGSFTWKYQWNGTYNSANQHEDKMFDEKMDTCLQGWSFGNRPNPETPATWLVWIMRLPDGTAPVAAYNFAPYRSPSTNPAACPNNWLVEASHDGVTWFEVDARFGESASAVLPSTEKTYCNNGHPIGFTSGCDRWLAPTGAVLEVSNGAAIELPNNGAVTAAGLAVDFTIVNSTGSIVNFCPSESGTLFLTCVSQHPHFDDFALPIMFSGIVDGANVEGWTVVLNGMPTEARRWGLRIDENGVFRVTRRPEGLSVSFK